MVISVRGEPVESAERNRAASPAIFPAQANRPDSGGLLAVNKIAFYLARMQARGIPAEDVLAGTGLGAEQVRGLFRGSPAQYRTIIANMLRLTADPFLGIALGSEFKISDFGVLGYAALSSSTLRQSRKVIAQYYTLNEHIIKPTVTVNDERWCVEIEEIFPLGKLVAFAIEEYVSRVIELAWNLTNRRFPVLALHLTYPAPQDLDIYRERFDCPLLFEQPKNLILFDIGRIDDPISLANAEVFKICERQCQLTSKKIALGDSLTSTIRTALINAPGEFPTLEIMAERLQMKPRTLRRQLLAEQITYQRILDETREDLAMQYLEYTSLTPKEIGFLLGYSDVSNFRRAFRSWTGKKISDYR